MRPENPVSPRVEKAATLLHTNQNLTVKQAMLAVRYPAELVDGDKAFLDKKRKQINRYLAKLEEKSSPPKVLETHEDQVSPLTASLTSSSTSKSLSLSSLSTKLPGVKKI